MDTGTPKTWGKAEAQVAFDANPRTTGPFDEVIHEYKTHLRKALRRGTGKATRFFEHAIETLEAINQV